jgi:predicted metal-dependent hydrolase
MREKRRVEYGTHAIEFSVERRERRTLEIAVEPDASVVVTAPIGAEADKIDAKVRKRAAWILRQQRYFEAFLPRTPERCFVAGETHLYLGRQYRLRVIQGSDRGSKPRGASWLSNCLMNTARRTSGGWLSNGTKPGRM